MNQRIFAFQRRYHKVGDRLDVHLFRSEVSDTEPGEFDSYHDSVEVAPRLSRTYCDSMLLHS